MTSLSIPLWCKHPLVLGGMIVALAFLGAFLAARGRPNELELKGAQEAYVTDVAKCLAKNHTLINPEDAAQFLSGKGQDNVQTLEFLSNKELVSAGIKLRGKVFITKVQVSGKANFSGKTVKPILLRRKAVEEHNYAFKAEKGRFWVPKATSQCEKLRTSWTSFNNTLEYEFHN